LAAAGRVALSAARLRKTMNTLRDIWDFFQRTLHNLLGVSDLRSPQPGPLPLEFSPNRIRPWLRQNEQVIETLLGFARLVLAFYIFYFFFPALGGSLFENLSPAEVAASFRADNFLLKRIPDWFLYRLDWRIARYMIPPLFAMIAIFISGAAYVRDIYNLKDFGVAMRYVLSSMFSIRYPTLRIDGGKMDIPAGVTNPMEVIGGPGTVLIEPGNAVIFRKLNEASDISITQAYFLEPFEKIGSIASLEDQEGLLDDVLTVTRDGIRVKLRDVHFRYRIVPMEVDGRIINRSLESPYPYSEDAMRSMAYNLSINADGPDPWSAAVHRAVKSAITDYIMRNSIDYLTAPRTDTESPREGMRIELFSERRQASLREMGAELVWIDVGHIDIVGDEVDQQRVQAWASDFIGNTKLAQAFAEAKHLAYTDYARGEAQAEMILAITEGLAGVDLTTSTKENLRALILMKTAQVLDAMRDNNANPENKHG
jgi:hypothetical protein